MHHIDSTHQTEVVDSAPATIDDAQIHHHHHHPSHGHQEPLPDGPYHAHPAVDDLIHPGEMAAGITLETREFPTISRDATTGHSSRGQKSGWRKPSPYWVLWIHTGMAFSLAMSLGPKIELFNQLACDIHHSRSPNDITILPVQPNAQADHASFAPSALNLDDISINKTSVIVDFGEVPLSSAQQDRTSEVGREQTIFDPIMCRKNPAVQTIAARFNTAVGILLGIMSALTTGWWTRMSDKWGRKPVLSLAMASVMIGDVVFLLTAKYPTIVPGGYKFLYAGAIFSGLFGGQITVSAVKQAYIADCTSDSERSRYFAGLMGMGMVGVALGPLSGAFIVRWFSGALSVFYLSLAIRTFFVAVTVLFLPESLSAESMEVVKETEREQSLANEQRNVEEYGRAQGDNDGEGELMGVWKKMKMRIRWVIKSIGNTIWTTLSPLAIFWPKRDISNPKGKRDWNLTRLAVGFCFMILVVGSGDPLFQYTQLVFGWGPTEIGLFISTFGTTQAVYLLFVLPLIIRFFRYIGSSSTSSTPSSASSNARSEHQLIMFSLVISIITYSGIILSTTSTAFVISLLVSTIGEGVNPLVSSLALLLVDDPTSTGKMLGAMSVLTAVLGTVVGPMLFGLTYAATTGIYPQTFLVLALGFLVLTLIVFSMIRIRDKPRSTEDGQSTVDPSVHADLTADERSPLLTRDE